MAEKPPINDHREIYETVVDMKRRLNNSENEFNEFTSSREKSQYEYDQTLVDIENQLIVLRQEITSLKTEIKATVTNMGSFVKLLKLKAKKNDFSVVEDKIESWNPEQFVSKKSFKALFR